MLHSNNAMRNQRAAVNFPVRGGIGHSTILVSLLLSSLLTLLLQFHSSIAAQNIHSLEPGQPIERDVGSGETHFYQISLASGQFLHVVAEQLSINLAVTLFGPDGRRLIDISDWVELPERVWWIAESTGSYRLAVSTGKEKPGRYRLRVEELRPATTQDRLRIAAHSAWVEGLTTARPGNQRFSSQSD